MERHKPGTAAVLSLLIPGVGQIYNGDFLRYFTMPMALRAAVALA